MLQDLKEVWGWLPGFVAQLFSKGGRDRIASSEDICDFVSTRAAFVTQKTLYGYLKTRMGTSHPKMFADDTYIRSVNIAKMYVYAAGLSDLALFAAWYLSDRGMLDREAAAALAGQAYRRGLSDNAGAGDSEQPFDGAAAIDQFEKRLQAFDWWEVRQAPALFQESPLALYEWAPIAPELKRRDREIVRNSIRFAWREIRAEFEKRLDREAFAPGRS